MSEHRRLTSQIQWENLGLRIRTVLKHTNPKQRILVVGSGKGELPTLLRLHGYENIRTLDIDPKVKPDTIHDITQPTPWNEGVFDVIIAFHVLEHLRYAPEAYYALREIHRLLKKDGLFFFAVPYRAWFLSINIRFCRWKAQFKPRKILKHFKGNSQHFWECSRDHPEKLVKDLLTTLTGFVILKKVYTVFNPVELFLICKKEAKK